MAPFTSFFGDYLHGLWITWTSSSPAGETQFEAVFQANYRARMYTWGNSAVDTDLTLDYDYTGEAGGSTWTGGAETF